MHQIIQAVPGALELEIKEEQQTAGTFQSMRILNLLVDYNHQNLYSLLSAQFGVSQR